MAKAYVVVDNVSKTIKGNDILRNITTEFERGKIHGIIGRNGSGKSMLLKIISGLTPPSSGQVIINGKVLGKDFDFPPKMSCIIESPGFLSGESGFNNLRYLQSLTRKPDKKQIAELLEMVGLKDHMHKKVGKYSTGMKQRLGLAQVLMDESDFIILDEPLSGLDDAGMNQFRMIFLELRKQGKTLIIATHIPEDVDSLCDTVSRMSDGRFSVSKGR